MLADGVKEKDMNLAIESLQGLGPGDPRCSKRWWERDGKTWGQLKVYRDQPHPRSSYPFQETRTHHHPHPRRREIESIGNLTRKAQTLG